MTETIIGAAIEVHRDKGPGLIESIYEWCLTKEFELRGLSCVSQKLVVIAYKGFTREKPLRSLFAGGRLRAGGSRSCVEKILPIHKAQLLSYMKLLNIPIGLLIKLHEMKRSDWCRHRLILPGREPMKARSSTRENRENGDERLLLLSVPPLPPVRNSSHLRL